MKELDGREIYNNSITDDPMPCYIMSCDIGTSTLRCIIYNKKAVKIGSAFDKIELLCPQPGYVEIDPSHLWEKLLETVKRALEDARLCASQILCMGLSTQRATFILWDKVSGEPLHKFITWKDIRADSLVREWNKSWIMKGIRLGSSFLYHILRKKRHLAASILKFQNIQVNMRLKWMIENDAGIQAALKKGLLMFGTIDTWLVYKLTGEKVSDQGAAMFGSCGFNQGDVKITLGTGAFFDLNTGMKPHTSQNGIYPVVGWKDQHEVVYMAEGGSNDNGIIIQWGKDMGLYAQHSDTSAIAEAVEDTAGVYFIPSFQGIQAPINDPHATGGFLGLSINTRKEHLVRAMLESLAFRVYQIYCTMIKEVKYHFRTLRIDGGVAQNDFLMQLIATLTGKILERPLDIETSSLGCCFLAGFGAGVWKDKGELETLREVGKCFHPQPEKREGLLAQMGMWERALNRFTGWHLTKGSKDKGSSQKMVSQSATPRESFFTSLPQHTAMFQPRTKFLRYSLEVISRDSKFLYTIALVLGFLFGVFLTFNDR